MGRLRMPPINEDERFDLIDADDLIEFLRLYQLSEDRGWRGLLKDAAEVCYALTDSYHSAHYYGEVMWRLEAVGLLRYEAGDGWSIPEYAEWNAEDWAGLTKPRKPEQLGLDIPLSQSVPSPLNAVQAGRFGCVWHAYPGPRRGSRIECEREWRNLNPDDEETARIAASIPVFLAHDHDWQRGAVPQLRRFLHGQHWENPPAPIPEAERTNLVRFDQSKRDQRETIKARAKEELRRSLNL